MDYRWLKWHNQRENATLENLSDRSLYAVLSPQFYEISTRQFLSLTRKGISLKLKNLTMEDQGLYTCLVSNSVGFSVRSAFLSVKYPLKSKVSIWSFIPLVYSLYSVYLSFIHYTSIH